MIEVTQTKLGMEGNCHAACIASIFEVPIELVPSPNFEELESTAAWGFYLARLNNEFFMPRGFYAATFAATFGDTGELIRPAGYSILGVATDSGIGAHALVCLDGEVVWNPDPSGFYDDSKPFDWTVFIALDPSQLKGIV